MIEATVTVHDRNSAGNLDEQLMYTKHTFSYRSTRAGDTVTELEDLIGFLEKLRVGNGGKPNQMVDPDMAKLSDFVMRACIHVGSLHRYACEIDNPTLRGTAISLAYLVGSMVSDYFPHLAEYKERMFKVHGE